MKDPEKPWYTRPIPLIIGSLLAFSVFSSLSSPAVAPETSNTAAAVTALNSYTQQATPVVTPIPAATKVQQTSAETVKESGLSNNKTYTNVDGATVHAPAYSTDNSVPQGASAKCGDGTYSFSLHRSGTCSHHGGVITWY